MDKSAFAEHLQWQKIDIYCNFLGPNKNISQKVYTCEATEKS